MKRNKEVKVRFTDDELALLNSFVLKAGYTSREKYMRTTLLKVFQKNSHQLIIKNLLMSSILLVTI